MGIYTLSQSIAFNLSNVFHYLKTKKLQQKTNQAETGGKTVTLLFLTGTLPVSAIEK